jgi:hypothetical protein
MHLEKLCFGDTRTVLVVEPIGNDEIQVTNTAGKSGKVIKADELLEVVTFGKSLKLLRRRRSALVPRL